ncbi:hypothetical protein GJ842_27170 [Salmonella enterica]|nr:hypothetical protein [Salmonella enterica]
MSQDMRERIFAAADALFAASETGEFPNVEAVRQESRAGMNYVVEAMKEWRQNQRRQVMTVRDPLPPELHTMIQEAGQHFWTSARQLANESLDAARSAFESEKNDLIQLSAEQSAAFERQATELAITLERLAELERLAAAAGENEREMSRTLEATREARQRAEQEAALSRLQAEENARRADELRAELEHAHREAAAAAREAAARLRGELEAVRTQNAALLAALKSPPDDDMLSPS